jgi:PAS domain S-box-containing protein
MPTLRITMELVWVGSLAILLVAALAAGRSRRYSSVPLNRWVVPTGIGLLLLSGAAGFGAGPRDVGMIASVTAVSRTAGLLVLVFGAWGWMQQFDRQLRDNDRWAESRQALEARIAGLLNLERQHESILTGIRNVGIAFLDAEMRLVWANTRSLAQTGNTNEDIDGRRCYEIRRGLTAPCADCQTLEVFRTGEYQESEARKEDGRIYFLQSNPVRDDDGNLIGVLNADTDITDRKTAEMALRRSEEKYRTLVETISEAIYEVDAQGTVTYISAGITRILGSRPEEIIGRAFIDFACPKDRRKLIERFAELRAGITRPSEYRIMNNKGEPHWVETFSQPRFEDERFVGLVGVMTDIHQRKLLEKESEQQKQLLEATLNSTADGILAVDRQDRILTWNRRFETMWHLSTAQLEQMNAIQEVMTAVADPLADEDKAAALGLFDAPPDETTYEIAVAEKVFEVVSIPLTSDGRTTGQVWNFRDITRSKAAEAALLRSEEKFSKLFDACPIWSELVSLADGRFIEVNQAFLDISGYDREAVIGKSSIEIGLWPDPDARREIIAHFKQHSRMDSRPCQFRMRDGQIRHFLWSAEAVEVGGTHCLLSSLLDVTEQHHMERALRQSEERYRSLYSNMPVGLFRTTPDGRIISANPALVRLFGYDDEAEFMNRPATSMYIREDAREAFIAALSSDGEVALDAVEFRRRDGSPFWASLSAVKISDRNGRFLYLDGELKDVTKRIQAEHALRESEKKYRLLVDNAYDGIFITGDGRVKFSNPSTCRILGYAPEEMADMPL